MRHKFTNMRHKFTNIEILGFRKDDIRLIYNLFKMNIRDRYLGSALGLSWAVLQPTLLLGVYTFVFGFVFKSKIPGSETTLAYVIWMISGFVPYLAFADALNGTANSILGGSGLVKNIVFKSETLPIASTLTSAVPFGVGMFFLLIIITVDGNYPTWHIIALIPVIFLQFAFLAGMAFFLSSTTVFIRDITQALPTAVMLLLFFTPIFYPIDALPNVIRKFTFFNPLFQITHPYREIILYHRLPDWRGLVYMSVLSAVIILAGLKYFRRLKGYFEMKL